MILHHLGSSFDTSMSMLVADALRAQVGYITSPEWPKLARISYAIDDEPMATGFGLTIPPSALQALHLLQGACRAVALEDRLRSRHEANERFRLRARAYEEALSRREARLKQHA